MLKKHIKHAFTIVELVIVIAVISVLAAVLIPAFSSIIHEANVSADTQTAKNISTLLAISDEITAVDSLEAALQKEFPNNLDKILTPKSESQGNHFWYNIKNNAVILAHYDEIATAMQDEPQPALIFRDDPSDASVTSSSDSSTASNGSSGDDYEDVTSGFNTDAKGHRRFGNYYLLDMGGDIGDALKAIDTKANVSDAVTNLTKIANDQKHPNRSIAVEIIRVLGEISEVTNFQIKAEGTGVTDLGNTYYVPYSITDLKLTAFNFESNTGADASQEISWTSNDVNYAAIGGNSGLITLNPSKIIEDEVSELTFTATADAGVEDSNGEKLFKSITIKIQYPIDLDFTIGSEDFRILSDNSEINLKYSGNSAFAFVIDEPLLKFEGVNVACNTTVTIQTNGSNLFTISEDSGKYTLTLNELNSYDGIAQEFTITVGSAITKTYTVSVTDLSSEPFKVNEPFVTKSNEFLYRAGNGNAFPLSVFFGSTKPGNGTLYIYDVLKSGGGDDAPIGTDGKFTALVNGQAYPSNGYEFTANNWADIQIKFSGTGVAKLKIGETSISIEVVDGNNIIPVPNDKPTVSSPANGTNLVLLCDAKIADGEKIDFVNSILFGNDFILDVSMGYYSGNNTAHIFNYVVNLNNSTLNNVRVIGKPFDAFSTAKEDANNTVNVYCSGNNVIINSYISGCAAPIRLNGGTLEIINSTLSGGSFANLDILNGNLILDNVTTINQKSVNGSPSNDGSVGLGIVIYFENVSSSKITIKNDLKQYNFLTKTDIENIKINGGINTGLIADAVFSNATEKFIYTDSNGTEWINTGIIALTDIVKTGDVDGSGSEEYFTLNYGSALVNISVGSISRDGFIYSVLKEHVVLATPSAYTSAGQGEIKPSYLLDNSKNNVSQEEGSNSYCKIDGDKIEISFDEGESKVFDLKGLVTVTKHGKSIELVNTYLNGETITNNSTITFDTEGEYILRFVFNDRYNYNCDGTVRVTEFAKQVYISVTEVAAEAKNATFAFGNHGFRTELINGEWYVMPDVTATVEGEIGSTTVGGKTVYYSIIAGYTSNGKTSQTSGTNWYMYFPVFGDVVKITDYKDGGTGEEITYDKGTTELPAGLSVEDPASKFQYSSAGAAPTTPKFADQLVYTSPQMEGVNRDPAKILAKYTYVDNKGTAWHYFVRYDTPQIKNSACVTPDTLVTLADGTQKEIQHVGYEDQLLVWNHFLGRYDVVPAAIIFNHGWGYNTVIKLNFSDGTQVKVTNLHQFLDLDLNKYVSIDADSVAEFVGHKFAKQLGDGYTAVTLESYEISEEYIEAYGIISSLHYNILVEGMFSADFMKKDYDLFNYFTIGEGLVFDANKMQKDIEQYGLYTYEDFADYLTYEQFVGFNVQYFKIAVGKGLYTYEGILNLIDEYLNK